MLFWTKMLSGLKSKHSHSSTIRGRGQKQSQTNDAAVIIILRSVEPGKTINVSSTE